MASGGFERVDTRGRALYQRLEIFEDGLRELHKLLHRLLQSHERHIKDMREFSNALSGPNACFSEEGNMALRDGAHNIGRGFQDMANDDDVLMYVSATTVAAPAGSHRARQSLQVSHHAYASSHGNRRHGGARSGADERASEGPTL